MAGADGTGQHDVGDGVDDLIFGAGAVGAGQVQGGDGDSSLDGGPVPLGEGSDGLDGGVVGRSSAGDDLASQQRIMAGKEEPRSDEHVVHDLTYRRCRSQGVEHRLVSVHGRRPQCRPVVEDQRPGQIGVGYGDLQATAQPKEWPTRMGRSSSNASMTPATSSAKRVMGQGPRFVAFAVSPQIDRHAAVGALECRGLEPLPR